jgi:hypothetical protein
MVSNGNQSSQSDRLEPGRHGIRAVERWAVPAESASCMGSSVAAAGRYNTEWLTDEDTHRKTRCYCLDPFQQLLSQSMRLKLRQ